MDQQSNMDFEQPKAKKPFPTKIVVIVSSVIAVAAIGAVTLFVMLNHACSFGEWAETKAASCAEYGEKTRVCQCGKRETKPIEKTAHSYGAWIEAMAGNCSEYGKIRRICSVCNSSEERRTSKNSDNHLVVKETGVSATCTKAGITEGSYCSLCDKVLSAQQIIPSLGHSYDDKYDAICNVCNFERIAACRHPETVTVKGGAATCTVAGLSDGTFCKKCEDFIVRQKTIPALGHTPGDWITDSEATCTADGDKHQVCSVCDETIGTETIAAFGHTPGDWITDSEATCTADGSKLQICSACDETIGTETIAAFGHTPGDWITDSEATCTADGSKHQICSVCDETIKQENISAGHRLNTNVVAATANSNAKLVSTCSKCDYSNEENISRISVSAQLTGSGITVTGGGQYNMRSFEVKAHGGYGQYKYKFEAGTNLLRDFSVSNEIEVYGNALIDLATITITVMDDAGQKTVYKIKGDGTFVDTYVTYD